MDKPIAHCVWCEEPLYEGDDVYNIDDELWCEKCMRTRRVTLTEDMVFDPFKED